MPVGAPPAAPTVRTPPGTAACPRCGAAITGDYKFCPACAHRLVRGAPEADDVRRGRRRSALLGGAVTAVVLGAVAVGVSLFHPDWFVPGRPRVEPPSAPEWESYVTPVLTVDRMRADLVEVSRGFAFEVPIDVLPLGEPWDEMLADLRTRFPDTTTLEAWTWYPLRVLRYEVTRGQYEEFLRDVLDHPERLPRHWKRELERGDREDAEDVVLGHVPAAWRLTKDERTVGWSLPEPDRNLPVTQVSCLEAQAFCEWASQRIGVTVRLPMAMEWVRIARAGIANPKWLWPWGTEPLRYACNNLASYSSPQPVHYRYPEPGRTGGATPEGVYAMAGNAAEWALDHDLAPLLGGVPITLLKSPPTLGWKPFPPERAPTTALAYGGSFRSGINDCRVDVYRRFEATDGSRDDVGFRVVAVDDGD